MNKQSLLLIALSAISISSTFAAPVSLELIDHYQICDDAPHSAFTDLIWKGCFFTAFRQGRSHASTDGTIRVMFSPDADNWRHGATIALEGYDLRDAHLSITPDDRIMLIGGVAPREKDNQSAPTGAFVSFSTNGTSWTTPEIVQKPGRWLWNVTWHKSKAYGVSYAAPDRKPWLELLTSSDGLHYTSHVPELLDQGRPNETTLRFADDNTCYALVRREGNTDDSTAMLGQSSPPYKSWQWRDLGPDFKAFGGPNFVHIAGPHYIAAGRMHPGGAHTALCHLDVNTAKMTKLLKLPSGGDTSYPGLVWVNDLLYVTYYSSHENKTSIYLAKVKVTLPEQSDNETFGAEPNPTGNPIGGAERYSRILTKGDYPVAGIQELTHALEMAQPGQTVYIEPTAQIDLTGHPPIKIPASVTIASDRGRQNSPGALIYSTDLAASPLLLAEGPDIRITGLRLQGPDPNRRTEQMQTLYKQGKYYSIPNSDAVICSAPNLEVDNCEISAFSHAGVFLKKGAANAHIHHNNIHHNQRSGLGYGVCLDQSNALIEANLFDYCRHHIAATGRPNTSYEARYNIVGPNANGHSFDMHGGADRKDGTNIAGDHINIHHNTFNAPSVRAVLIRGLPRQKCEIHHNIFIHPNSAKAIAQTHATGNMQIHDNKYALTTP